MRPLRSAGEKGADPRPRTSLGTADVSARGLVRLAIACGALAMVWLLVLPLVGGRPKIAARIRHADEQGIDPGAKFYTELRAMPRIARRIDRRRIEHRESFWRWPSPTLRHQKAATSRQAR